MDTITIINRYSYYSDIIKKAGEIPICQTITLDDLKSSRGVVQSGYKEIKEMGFKDSLIDYLCWISLQYVGYLASVAKMDVSDFISDRSEDHPNEIKNSLRLIVKNPSYLFKENEEIKFLKCAGLWFRLFQQSLIDISNG